MQQSAGTLEGTLRFLRTVHLLMLSSMFLYVWIAEKLIPHQPQSLDHTFLAGIGAIAVAAVGAALLVRAKTNRVALQALQIDSGDVGSLNRLRSGSIVSFVLCEEWCSLALRCASREQSGSRPPRSISWRGADAALVASEALNEPASSVAHGDFSSCTTTGFLARISLPGYLIR